jgi:hypothetical protein
VEIKLEFASRELNYEIDGIRCAGIDNLIENIGQKSDKIKRISLSGDTDSYTLMRQVYLLINLCKAFSDCEVAINGKQMSDRILIPDYAAAGYKFNGEST